MSRLTHSGTKEAKNDVTIKEILARLAEYEDTGLSPEQVQELAERDTAKNQIGAFDTREILFKAKRLDNGEWVEGYYVQLPKPSVAVSILTNGELCAEDVSDYIIENKVKQHSNFSNSFPIEIVECEQYEINPDTLCQFTGLTDKNGKKIWENDIVDTFEESSKSFLRNVIKFEEGCFKVFTKCYLPMHLDNYTKSDFEVIGNIFDDADLLEVE